MNEAYIIEALELIVIGMGGVFTSLLLFYILMLILQKIDKSSETARLKRYAKKANQTEESEITPEIVAAIAAAIEVALHRPIVIRKVHFANTSDDNPWTRTTKLFIHDSHNIHKGY
jgi:Na+-transporting methylmalonyl-CoA/oxaloacetate decarboxylase gamma subunit